MGKTHKIKDSYTGDISLKDAVRLIAGELGASIGGESGFSQLVTEQTAMRFPAVYAWISLLDGTIA